MALRFKNEIYKYLQAWMIDLETSDSANSCYNLLFLFKKIKFDSNS